MKKIAIIQVEESGYGHLMLSRLSTGEFFWSDMVSVGAEVADNKGLQQFHIVTRATRYKHLVMYP